MTVLLDKGGRQSLSAYSKVKVCTGWRPIDHAENIAPKKGLLGKFQNKLEEVANRLETPDMDIDLSCIALDINDRRLGAVFFNQKIDNENGIVLDKDDRTGMSSKGGDDETIHVDLTRVSQAVNQIHFWVDIYECITRSQHLGMVRDGFVRVVDEATGAEICRYNMSDDYRGKTAIHVCSFYRKDGEWKFKAVGEGRSLAGILNIMKEYKN
jgi:tellurium resistance protein TerD